MSELPRYVRLGKKRGKARLDLAVREATQYSGSFRLNHPIGAYDHDEVPTGNVVTKSMQPTPLVLQADYEGEFLRIDRQTAGNEPVAVELPAGLTFLATKR